MKNLYLLHDKLYYGVELRVHRFEEACSKLGVHCIVLDNTNISYLDLPRLTKDDLLYKVSDFGFELESLLLNTEVTTFYKENPVVAQNKSSTDFIIPFQKNNIRQPKTILHHRSINRKILKNYVKYLGGFPLIIKAYGLSRGIGVIKVDSWASFISSIDYLTHLGIEFLIRQYIECNAVSRLMVLNNKVIASWETETMDYDFRNVTHFSLESLYKEKRPVKFPAKVQEIAVLAVNCLGLEFGAVDIVFDDEHQPFVLEVNFPCGLSFDPSGQNKIVEKMVGYLVEKSNRSK